MDLGVIFLTGLTTGGLTCLAIQGGLLATALAGQGTGADILPPQAKHKHRKHRRKQTTAAAGLPLSQNAWPVAYFLTAKLLAHTALGFLLGALGSAVQITREVQAVMQIIAALFMLVTALNMFNVHPIFRYFVIQPPKVLTRLVRNQAKSREVFAPALLGVLTIFIPCGTTQAMEILAVSSGSPLLGAAIMFAFVLGTSPTFFVLGFLATQLRGKFQTIFTTAAAALIVLLAVLSLDAGLNLLGSPLAPRHVLAALFPAGSSLDNPVQAEVINGIQEVTINAKNDGYWPSYVKATSNEPLRLRLKTDQTLSCTLAFAIPQLRIEKILPQTGETLIDLPPMQSGDVYFTCSMGMYTGVITLA